jgi:hypothetical protein
MATLAPYAAMIEDDPKRRSLRISRAAWLIGVSVQEHREIVAGDRMLSLETYRRVSDLHGWPETFLDSRGHERYAANLVLRGERWRGMRDYGKRSRR